MKKKTALPLPELLKQVQEQGYYVAKTPDQKPAKVSKANMKRWEGGSFRFGVVSCTHLGSRYQQLTALNEFYDLCKKDKVDTVLHCGD